MDDASNAQVSLPRGFEHFAPYAGWALGTQTARRMRRMRKCTLDDLRALYDFGLAPEPDGRTRIEHALEYLDRFPLEEMPDDARHLLEILLSMAEVSVSVECWGEVLPSHAATPERFPPTPRTDVL